MYQPFDNDCGFFEYHNENDKLKDVIDILRQDKDNDVFTPPFSPDLSKNMKDGEEGQHLFVNSDSSRTKERSIPTLLSTQNPPALCPSASSYGFSGYLVSTNEPLFSLRM